MMTGKEMERAVEIILNNQANFELQFEKTNRQIEETDKRLGTFIERLGTFIEETDKRFGIFAETQTEFIQITLRHIEAQGEINASIRGMLRELKESQTRADERLGRLTETVEQHISEGHNGKT